MTYEVGQKVVVFDGSAGRKRQYDGKITKVARTLVTVAYHGTEGQFDMDTGYARTKNYSMRTYFRTPEQVAEHERLTAAMEVLKTKYHIELGMGHRITVEQAEAIVAALEALE